ncbi:MAG TPA: CBS domain-containing protein [Gemmatimonadaceae bacterium]|jgi:CBS domain-containing protein|nr:CBS domain-containing protein [Gemmatimonadaceae bacterium]
MKAADIMTKNPCFCSSNDSITSVAKTMRDNDCGAVPIVDNDRVVGIVTDRDLVIRGLATGTNPAAMVGEIATRNLCSVRTDSDVKDVERLMSDNQVRRVLVMDGDKCVGIVSQADLARAIERGDGISDREVGIVVERISEKRGRAASRGDTSPQARL